MKIAIVFPSGGMTSTPCITSLAILLARSGIQVDIYTLENSSTASENSYAIFDGLTNLHLYIYPIATKNFWENIPLVLLGFFPWWLYRSFNKKYDVIIAAGVRALFIIGLCSTFKSHRYIYLSLELYITKEMNSFKGKVFKCIERFFNRKATFSIIQDKQRAGILQRENKVQLENIMLFPNSTLNAGNRNKSEFSLDIFDKHCLQDKKIILYAGSIFAKWAMTRELVREVRNWPADWVLLLHSRARVEDLQRFLFEEQSLINDKIILSTEPLNSEKYEELVKRTDVGIALCGGEGVSENMYYLGYSSGKVSQYLKCGKPVIVTKLPLISELIEKHNCGFNINQIYEIKDALNAIFDRYDSYSSCARNAFEEVLNPELYMEPLLEKLYKYAPRKKKSR